MLVLLLPWITAAHAWPRLQIQQLMTPEYAEAARELNLVGDCRIRVTVGSDGVPQSAAAIDCAAIFQYTSTPAALASRFAPVGTPGQRWLFDLVYHYALTPYTGPEHKCGPPGVMVGTRFVTAIDDSGLAIPSREVTVTATQMWCEG